MKIALFTTNPLRFRTVFTDEVMKKLSSFGEISDFINKKNLQENKDFLKDCEIAFSTWGMPKFSEEEIRTYMPKLKAVFYAAGTVQYFAPAFLNCGVKIFSAYAANAVPVAEFTFAQISLASKGYFQASKNYRLLPLRAFSLSKSSTGNFGCKVGIVGLGAIGQAVAKKLSELDVEILAYDPFVSEKTASALNVKLCELETIFRECDVITNHLADKKELKNIFGYRLFKLMKKRSVFINTGRGAQVNEFSLAWSLLSHPSRTFVGDVIKSEYFPFISPLFWCHNAVLTPHMAGSTGNETQRMAYYMISEAEKFICGKETEYEITSEILKRMA